MPISISPLSISISAVLDLLGRVAADVWATLAATWPSLLISVLFAAALSVYVGTERLAAALRRRSATAVAGAVGLALWRRRPAA